MAARMMCRSSRSTASRADFMAPIKLGIASVARIPMIAITIISSIRVKPASCLRILRMAVLPVRVLGAVERRALRLRIHVENTLSAETVRCGVVLHRTHAPLGLAGHRIDWNATKKLDLLAL